MVRGTLDEVTAELEKVEEEARQSQLSAGQKAAEAAELSPDELDQEIELEQFELEDDVPQTIIDLVESDEPVEASWNDVEEDEVEEIPFDAVDEDEIIDIASPKPSSAAPFDFNAEDDDYEDDAPTKAKSDRHRRP